VGWRGACFGSQWVALWRCRVEVRGLAREGGADSIGLVGEAPQVLLEVQRMTSLLTIVQLDLQQRLEKFLALLHRVVNGQEVFDARGGAAAPGLVETGANVGNTAPGIERKCRDIAWEDTFIHGFTGCYEGTRNPPGVAHSLPSDTLGC
jgi:hypothetical protein